MGKKFEGKVPFVAHDLVVQDRHWTGTFKQHVFSLTVHGSAEYQFSGIDKLSLEPGDFLHFAPEAWQDWTVTGSDGWNVCFIIIDVPSRLRHLIPKDNISDGISKNRFSREDALKVCRAFDEMVDWNRGINSIANELIYNQLEYILLLLKSTQSGFTIDQRVQQACEFLHQNMESFISLEDVVQAVSLSKAQLSNLFQQSMGVSPILYLEKIRMERAAQLLLLTSETTKEISQRLCYSDVGYFNKRFKKYWGKTPKQYRLDSDLSS